MYSRREFDSHFDKMDRDIGRGMKAAGCAWLVGAVLTVGFWSVVLYLAWRLVMANT